MRKFFVARGIFFAVLLIVAVIAGLLHFVLQYQNNNQQNDMKLTSSLFSNNDGFPGAHTCDGQNVSPPLDIADVPSQTKTLALVLRDPDAPGGIFVHWIMFNISPKIGRIDIGEVPEGARQGKTTDGKTRYVGPCPPSGTHRYIFTLYALDTELYLNEGASIEQFNAAISGHTLATAGLLAKYR